MCITLQPPVLLPKCIWLDDRIRYLFEGINSHNETYVEVEKDSASNRKEKKREKIKSNKNNCVSLEDT